MFSTLPHRSFKPEIITRHKLETRMLFVTLFNPRKLNVNFSLTTGHKFLAIRCRHSKTPFFKVTITSWFRGLQLATLYTLSTPFCFLHNSRNFSHALLFNCTFVWISLDSPSSRHLFLTSRRLQFLTHPIHVRSDPMWHSSLRMASNFRGSYRWVTSTLSCPTQRPTDVLHPSISMFSCAPSAAFS